MKSSLTMSSRAASERYVGLRPTNSKDSLPACHSERSEESASYVLPAKADSSSFRSSE
jgi:hypothetical protein